ncbi:MAG: CHAT domain-containing protein, partial [Chloroflexi bacterium]|nr:CHAT domain-containing protein [Chloroflexota bacterium]
MDYLDFELEIGAANGSTYPVTVIQSPAGETQAPETMQFPFDGSTLENQLSALQNVLTNSNGTNPQTLSTEVQTVQNFGEALFNALFIGQVLRLYDVSRQIARSQNKGLRLNLSIQPPALAALPWEFLYDPGQARYPCLFEDTSLVRYLQFPTPPEPLTVTPPLSILGMVASPKDLPALDVAGEQQRIETALADLTTKGLVRLTWVSGRTWEALQQAMSNGTWHIFHFIGHGDFSSFTNEGMVALEDDAGQVNYVNASQLGLLLADHHPLRLVMLNSCAGARGSTSDIFSSTAATLVRQGIPAVLANQYNVTDDIAIKLSCTFYEVLTQGSPVDTAVSEARRAIALGGGNTLEWGVPALYMHTLDSIPFNLVQTASQSSSPPATTTSGIASPMPSSPQPPPSTLSPPAPVQSTSTTAPTAPYPPANAQLVFNDPLSQPYQWDAFPADSNGGPCQFINGTYHISQPNTSKSYYSSLSVPLSNLVFEVQMMIIHGDWGGIFFRMDTTGNKYYAFEIGTSGFYSLYVGIDEKTSKMLVSKPSPAIITGLNRTNTIAVVANGDTLDLYVNYTKVDSVKDNTYTNAGSIALIADAGSNPTEVAFSNAKVWTLSSSPALVQSTSTTAPTAPYPPANAQLAFDDPLSQPYQWDAYTPNSTGGSSEFANGTYHIHQSQVPGAYSISDEAQFCNLVFEVQMMIIHGDSGGIIVRMDPTNTNKYYLFEVGRYGSYGLY